MNLPNILIIGAMKAGTTSLYMDIAQHPQVYFTADKEPHSLCHDEVLTTAGRQQYASLYAKAEAGQLCCDASTGYSKRPEFEGVVSRAKQVLSADFKVIYLLRHPIDRIISQHHHEHFAGTAGPGIDEEVRRNPRYIQYSRYCYQLEPWLQEIGRERIHLVRFEDFTRERQQTAAEVFRFLGLDPQQSVPDADAVYNKSAGKPFKTKFWNAIQQSGAYRRLVRPLTPVKLRQATRQVLLPRATQSLAKPTESTLAFLRESLQGDVSRLGELTGWKQPIWEGIFD